MVMPGRNTQYTLLLYAPCRTPVTLESLSFRRLAIFRQITKNKITASTIVVTKKTAVVTPSAIAHSRYFTSSESAMMASQQVQGLPGAKTE